MAAASLTGAFEEIGSAFEAANPGVKVVFNFGGSQQLAKQLSQGAPADVFASANTRQMQAAVESGRIEKDSPVIFVRNRLVVIVPKENPAQVNQLEDLARAGVKLVFASKEVPVGQYTLDFLDRASASSLGAGYREDVLGSVVSYEESVRSVLTKVALGEADAGVVYTSDLAGPDGEKVGQVSIPDEWNVIAEYPIATVLDSKNAQAARKFVDRVLSAEGQDVLEKWGFMNAKP